MRRVRRDIVTITVGDVDVRKARVVRTWKVKGTGPFNSKFKDKRGKRGKEGGKEGQPELRDF
jgi:hypothetical protein